MATKLTTAATAATPAATPEPTPEPMPAPPPPGDPKTGPAITAYTTVWVHKKNVAEVSGAMGFVQVLKAVATTLIGRGDAVDPVTTDLPYLEGEEPKGWPVPTPAPSPAPTPSPSPTPSPPAPAP